jgi:hypothetical protein
MLLPILKEHMLENYTFVIYQEKYYSGRFGDADLKEFLKAMKDRKLLDPFPLKKCLEYTM